ncbi:hypothetical protein PoB_003760600 [Plakobranchus ocellatus]|uniref:Uncharacterized protein n=1 Tax=Plakobranchus ocellatus TaxID=259542 RepID=A0AAV4AX53_9GAST|nr:hypothetical protein PoB_003760600 [Plakobranchus ocellatus]
MSTNLSLGNSMLGKFDHSEVSLADGLFNIIKANTDLSLWPVSHDHSLRFQFHKIYKTQEASFQVKASKPNSYKRSLDFRPSAEQDVRVSVTELNQEPEIGRGLYRFHGAFES